MESAQPQRLAARPELRENLPSFIASISPGTLTPANPSDSPLTQQTRPEVFEPKVVELYRRLFTEVEDEEISEGFWRTLFLLKPEPAALRDILNNTDSNTLLHLQHQPQQLLLEAVAHAKEGKAPTDEHALDTLTVFFTVILAKKFTNSSSDLIEVLAGLDHVDAIFTELVTTLDFAIKDGRTMDIRQKAVRTAIAVVSGGYQTALVSYFIHRDFFPALMKLVHQLDNALQAAEPLLLAGLLANYNKFEVHNQYRVRFSDFVNEETMTKVVWSVSWNTTLLRERYVAILDDLPAGWASSIGSTLSYVGLGAIAGAKPAAPNLTEEQQKALFSEQPGREAAILLTLYDFVLANKLFCHHLVTITSAEKTQPSPLSNLLSFTSYLVQHAYRTPRASSYAYLAVLILLILVEDHSIIKLLCENSSSVRLCRQRAPYLSLPKGERPYVSAILDTLVDGINHNLRKRLDTKLYLQFLSVISRILIFLVKSRNKLYYHWHELWRSLLSFTKFLTTYADDLKSLIGTPELIEALVDLLALALTSGELFVPLASDYDDLFYKLVESGDLLVKFRDTYHLGKDGGPGAINTLISASRHYQELIEAQKAKTSHLSPKEVSKIIKQGYETLSIEITESFDHIEAYREADHKVELKKIARVAVADAAAL